MLIASLQLGQDWQFFDDAGHEGCDQGSELERSGQALSARARNCNKLPLAGVRGVKRRAAEREAMQPRSTRSHFTRCPRLDVILECRSLCRGQFRDNFWQIPTSKIHHDVATNALKRSPMNRNHWIVALPAKCVINVSAARLAFKESASVFHEFTLQNLIVPLNLLACLGKVGAKNLVLRCQSRVRLLQSRHLHFS